MKHRTNLEQTSDRELVITRTFNAPARIVFEAWTKPELFKRWWVPKSLGLELLSYEAEVRTGGTYRLVFRAGDAEMAFHGKYLEVTPTSRLSWTNEEGANEPVTTVTFEEKAGKTLVSVRELYPSKEALDEARASGAMAFQPDAEGRLEAFDQLDELLASLGAS